MFISFKYKLAALTVGLMLLLLGGTFYRVQSNLEQKFIHTLEEDLRNARAIVAQLMSQRLSKLQTQASILGRFPLVRNILLDHSLDRITADDILQSEVLSGFPDIRLLMVAETDGKLLASSVKGKSKAHIDALFLQSPTLASALEGESSVGHVFVKNHCIQLVGLPIFLGEEFIGALLVGVELGPSDLAKITAMSSAQIVIFAQRQIRLSSTWASDQNLHQQRLQDLQKHIDQLPADDASHTIIQIAKLDQERFLFMLNADQPGFTPHYAIARSLDAQLVFVEEIRTDTLWIAAASALLGTFLSFLFSMGVSRPLVRLGQATDAVEQENYAFRVTLKSRDEFTRLGNSFNLMMEGLEEREKIRGVMNKVVSQEVADEMLAGKIQMQGEERIATLLLLRLQNQQTNNNHTTPQQYLAQLNDLYSRATFCIDAQRGMVDHYSGKGMLALFGIPVQHTADTQSALHAALQIFTALELFHLEHPELCITPTIAIDHGPLLAGNLGAAQGWNYTVLGDTMNRTHHLAKQSKAYGSGLFISERAYQQLQKEQNTKKNQPLYRWLDTLTIAASAQPERIYQVFTANPETIAQTKALIAAYEKALQAFHHGEIKEAARLAQAIHTDWPEDIASAYLWARCQ